MKTGLANPIDKLRLVTIYFLNIHQIKSQGYEKNASYY